MNYGIGFMYMKIINTPPHKTSFAYRQSWLFHADNTMASCLNVYVPCSALNAAEMTAPLLSVWLLVWSASYGVLSRKCILALMRLSLPTRWVFKFIKEFLKASFCSHISISYLHELWRRVVNHDNHNTGRSHDQPDFKTFLKNNC